MRLKSAAGQEQNRLKESDRSISPQNTTNSAFYALQGCRLEVSAQANLQFTLLHYCPFVLQPHRIVLVAVGG